MLASAKGFGACKNLRTYSEAREVKQSINRVWISTRNSKSHVLEIFGYLPGDGSTIFDPVMSNWCSRLWVNTRSDLSFAAVGNAQAIHSFEF